METQTATINGWTKTTIGKVYGFTSKPRGLKFPDTVDFIPMEAISERNETIDNSAIKKISKITSGTYVENGDFILAKITPSFENGKQGMISISSPFAYATTEVIPVQEIKSVSDKWFFAYWLRQQEVRSVLAGKMEGTTGRQRLSKTVLANTEILLPSLLEQKAIAQTLKTVQDAITEQEKLIAKLKELKRSMMQHLFTHGTKGEKTKMTEIGEVPESWEVVELGSVFKFSSGKSRPKDTLKTRTEVNKFPVYGGNGVLGYSVSSLFEDKKLIIGRVGEYCGCVHITESSCWISDNALYAKEKLREVNLDFYKHLLEHWNLNRYSNKMGQPLVTQGILAKVMIPYMEIGEQGSIANALGNIDQKTESSQEKLSAYQNLFRTLLHELMSGKRRIKNI